MNLSPPAVCRFVFLALLPSVLGACSTVGGLEPAPVGPAPEAKPAPAVLVGSDNEADRITAGVVELALAAIGTPYEWGGTDANGFDCSGLIQYAYGRYGVVLPRVSTAQMASGSALALDPSLLRPGDILGFSLDDPNKTSHVGLYVGNDEFIHSSSSGVRVSNLQNPYWQEHLIAARRMVQ